MKGSGNGEQALPNPIKEKPRGQNSGETENNLAQDERGIFSGGGIFDQLAQATGAKDAVIVLGNALATEKKFARRATRDRFARRMIEAGLLGEGLHRSVRRGRNDWQRRGRYCRFFLVAKFFV